MYATTVSSMSSCGRKEWWIPRCNCTGKSTVEVSRKSNAVFLSVLELAGLLGLQSTTQTTQWMYVVLWQNKAGSDRNQQHHDEKQQKQAIHANDQDRSDKQTTRLCSWQSSWLPSSAFAGVCEWQGANKGGRIWTMVVIMIQDLGIRFPFVKWALPYVRLGGWTFSQQTNRNSAIDLRGLLNNAVSDDLLNWCFDDLRMRRKLWDCAWRSK